MDASATLEFVFAVYAYLKRHKNHHLDWINALDANHPALFDRCNALWGGGSPDGCDLVVLIDRAGALTDLDLERLLSWLKSPDVDFSPPPPMPSETAEVQAAASARLESLARDPKKAAEYIATIEAFWRAIEPFWVERGREASLRRAAALASSLSRPEDWRRIIPGSFFRRQLNGQLLDAAAQSGNLLVTPLELSPAGQMIYALDDFVIISFGVNAGERTELRRRAAEHAATVYKVFSDPTRLAILSSLLNERASVTDLAGMFDLAQPTVSVHVKLLREAGLLESEREGNQTMYRSTPELVSRVLNDAQAELLSVEGC